MTLYTKEDVDKECRKLRSYQKQAQRYRDELRMGEIHRDRMEHFEFVISHGRTRIEWVAEPLLAEMMEGDLVEHSELRSSLKSNITRLRGIYEQLEINILEALANSSGQNAAIESLEYAIDEERAKNSALEEIIAVQDAEIAHLQDQLQSSDRHLPKAEYKKLSSEDRAKLKLDRSNTPTPKSSPPSPSQEQLDQAQTFFKSFLPPPTTKSMESPDPSEDSVGIVMDSVTEVLAAGTEAMKCANVVEVPAADTEAMKPAIEPTLERSSPLPTAPAIRKRSINSSVCSIGSESMSSFKNSSSAESISSVPSLKSILRANNSKSKLSTMLDDTASISTVDVSDDLAPDPKIFVMSSLRSSVGTSTVLTDALAPDPFIVSSTQPPATAVVLSDELAPD